MACRLWVASSVATTMDVSSPCVIQHLRQQVVLGTQFAEIADLQRRQREPIHALRYITESRHSDACPVWPRHRLGQFNPPVAEYGGCSFHGLLLPQSLQELRVFYRLFHEPTSRNSDKLPRTTHCSEAKSSAVWDHVLAIGPFAGGAFIGHTTRQNELERAADGAQTQAEKTIPHW